MTRKRNILLVSLIAMLSAGAVRAETATVSYVNTQDAKLADRIKTQDTRIATIRDWVNPQDTNGQRATLATTEQDAYRAINELKTRIDNVPAQVNADWNASSGTAQILNKPDLSQYATTSEMNTALQGKQDTLQFDNTPTAGSDNVVTSGAVAAAITAAQLDGQVDLTGYATETYVDNAVSGKANSSDLATVATSGDYDDLLNKPTIPAAQVQSDWNATSGMGEILNKPDLSQYATAADLADKQDALTEAQLNAVNSGVTSTTVSQVAANTQSIAYQDQLIAAKANTADVNTALAAKANSADLATVATTGDYDDLLNKPTIPAAQVNADWNAESGVAQILNKPTIPSVEGLVSTEDLADYAKTSDVNTALAAKANSADLADVATSGDYDDLLNKPTIPAAQVQADWNQTDSNEVDFIKNKPYVYTQAETDALLADKADTADVPAAQVQADWNQADSNEVDFIKNKPSVYTQSETDTLLAGKQATLTFDTEPTTGSSNPVTSAGIKAAIEAASFDPSSIAIDNTLSTTSTNAVQNKVVTGALDEKVPLGTIPSTGQYVLGFVDGVQMYIPIVDANGNSGSAYVAATGEPVTGGN